jgi:hypothetical protein
VTKKIRKLLVNGANLSDIKDKKLRKVAYENGPTLS